MIFSLFLGKIVGIYMLIVGISLVARQKMWSDVVHEFAKSRLLMVAVGFAELLLGLIVVLSHNVWTGWEAVITIIGWLMVIEALAYMFLPQKTLRNKIEKFNKPAWYITCGVAAMLIGAYLVSVSFGIGA